MSGWIKVEKDLQSDPRVLRMAKAVDRLFYLFTSDHDLDPCNALALPGVTLVCGALTRLWMYADSHIRDDDTLDLGAAEVDEWLGIPGFCAEVPADWLREIDEHTVELPGFQEHNGVEAKKRALTQKRVTQHRNKEKRTSVTPCNASALPDQTRPDQDQTRPNKKIPSESVSSAKPPDIVATVFSHWCSTWNHPKAALDVKRRALIQRALKGYTAEQLCESISGYLNSPHHLGQNERQTVYDDIGLFLRDAAHVDVGIRFARDPPAITSALAQHNVSVLSNWKPAELRDENSGHAAISSNDGEPIGGFRKAALPPTG